MPEATQQGLSTAISDGIGRVVADHTGRGPNSIRTTINGDLVVCILRDTFTKAERRLVETGQEEFVKELRLRFQTTMTEELVTVVEEATGREVEAYLSDHHIARDIAAETFILTPRAATPDHDGRGPEDHPRINSV